MANYLIPASLSSSNDLMDRLGQLIQIDRLGLDQVARCIKQSDIVFATGEQVINIAPNNSTIIEVILSKGAHLIVIPPFPSIKVQWHIPGVNDCLFRQADFKSIKICDEQLEKFIGLSEISILYNLVFANSFGRPLAITIDKETPISAFQYRSTWGLLICTTLLLSSTSIRSPRAHKVAFLQGLTAWLKSFSEIAIKIDESQSESPKDYPFEISILLIALKMLEKEGSIHRDQLSQKVHWILRKFGNRSSSFQMDKALNLLSDSGIIIVKNQGKIEVSEELLQNAIDQSRLRSYLRRLQ